MRFLLVPIIVFGASIAQAANVTIDFSDQSLPGTGNEEGFSTNGYDFTFGPVPIPQPNAFYINTTGAGDPGDLALIYCPQCFTAMERSDGASFSLSSFDAWTLFDEVGVTLQITGYMEGGGTLVETVDLTASIPAQPFAINWDGLVRVEFDSITDNAPQILDKITVNAVPVPAAVWLFGSGLGLLGWIRRRKTA